MTLPTLLQPQFWFSLAPPPLLPMVDRVIFSLCVIFVVVGIAAFLLSRRFKDDKLTRRLVSRSGNALLISGFVGLILYVFSYERVPVLSMRFGFFLWIVLMGILAWRIYRYAWKEIPAIRERTAEREQINKWLPKSKN